MTYPENLYLGEGGEVTADFMAARDEPDLVLGSGTRVTYLATGDGTGRGFGLYHWAMGSKRHRAEPHFHRTFSESFYVLSGNVGLYDGDIWYEASAGDFLYVPPGGIHAFRNHSAEPVSMLILFAPGAPREAYFEGLDGLDALSDADKAEFLVTHDNLYID